MLKNKQNVGILLIILVVTICAYKYYSKIKKDFINSELSKYLTYVPITYEDNLSEYESNGNDAYSGKDISLDDMSQKILLEQVFYKSEKSNFDVMLMNLPICKEKKCYSERVVPTDKFIEQLKIHYNIDEINVDRFKVPGGMVYRFGKYFVEIKYRETSGTAEKIRKVIKYEKKGTDLIIYEKAAFIVNHVGKSPNPTLYKYTSKKGKLIKLSKLNDKKLSVNSYFENNLDKFATFKHTFKLGEYNRYYYYKTEVIK